jgi:hypothetical protein
MKELETDKEFIFLANKIGFDLEGNIKVYDSEYNSEISDYEESEFENSKNDNS